MNKKTQITRNSRPEGVCQLTGEYGKFVAAHILPRALTRLSRSGEKAREAALGTQPRWKPPTWYDNELVIRKGEDILEKIDTPAIEMLRKYKLVWSSFKCDHPFTAEELLPLSDDINLREVSFSSTDEMRLFFLSIVWRAAASSRPEFADIQLTEDVQEDLRQRVLTQNAGNLWDYPIILDQLITRGPAQNRTPFMEESPIALNGIKKIISLPSIRIYLDGLVARVMLTKGWDLDKEAGSIFLGATEKTLIFARRFERSRTLHNLLEVISDYERRGYK